MVVADILGPRNNGAQGKTAQSQADSVDLILCNGDSPCSVMEFYRDTVLAADVTHASNTPLWNFASDNLHCCCTQALDGLNLHALETIFSSIARSNALSGFNVVLTCTDSQLKCLKDVNLVGIKINSVTKEEHARTFERSHLVIKERERCCYVMLSFDFFL